MTVADLIKTLSDFPPHARVIVNLGKNDLANGTEVRGAAGEFCMMADGGVWEFDDPEYEFAYSREDVVNLYGGLS